MVVTEFEFYPSGRLAPGYGRGEITAHEGIEAVTITSGEQIVAKGTGG